MKQTADPRNQDLQININGVLKHRKEAGVSPFDSSVQGGDAVWEGLRVYHGKIFRLAEHLTRLRHSALALAFAEIPSDDHIRQEIHRTLEANGMLDQDGVHIRLTLSRGVKITSGMDPRLNEAGPTLIVLAEWKAPVYGGGAGGAPGITLKSSSQRRFAPDALDPRIHHNNLLPSILAKIEANAAGADDALMLDPRGFVAETNATHLFIVDGGAVLTPKALHCPEGITRDAVLGLCDEHGITSAEMDLALFDFFRAEECFCTGTMGELVPVETIDGRAIGSGERPVLTRLQGLFRELAQAESESILG